MESVEEKQRREERLASFYKSPVQESNAAASEPKRARAPSLEDVDPVFRSEFNTIGYLAIGFSLIALLLIALVFFRPPKPKVELQALADAQLQTRQTLEKLAGQIAALDRRADRSDQGELVRSLRMTLLLLTELKEQGGPGARARAEELQAQVEKLLGDLQRGARAGTAP